jgi:hypothetical protein
LRLGEILIEAGVLKPDQLQTALDLQKKRQLRLGTILLQEGFVSEPQLVQALSRRLSIPWVSLWHIDVADELLELVPASVAEEFFLIPIYIRATFTGERALYVAMNDPTDDSALRFVAATAGMPVKPMIAGPSDLAAAIRFYYYGEEEEEEVVESPPPAPAAQQSPAAPKTASVPPPPPAQARPSAAPPPPPADVGATGEEEVAVDAGTLSMSEETPSGSEEGAEEDGEEGRVEDEASDPVQALEGNDDEEKQRAQREVEKHMFGVGPKRAGGFSLTLLDGTTIGFGGAQKKKPGADSFEKEDLIAGLRAAAKGTPLEDFLPSDKWEDYMAALLEILFKKHLVFFEEYLAEIKKKP